MSAKTENPEEMDEKAASEPVVEVVEPEKRVVSAEDGIAKLKEQLESEKRRRIEAEQRASEAAQAVYSARAEADDTNLKLVENAIGTVKANTASLKSAYAQAMQVGDYQKAADIQAEMSENAAKLLQLENGRQAMAEKPKQPAPAVDPVEAMARQMTPRSADWIRKHPEFVRDTRLYQKMVAAHNLVVADGVAPDTDEYFDAVEGHLRINRREAAEVADNDPTEQAAKVVSRRQSPVAAPVSRSGAAPGVSNPRTIRLTADEVEIARMTGLTEAEYWKQKQKIKSDARYN